MLLYISINPSIILTCSNGVKSRFPKDQNNRLYSVSRMKIENDAKKYIGKATYIFTAIVCICHCLKKLRLYIDFRFQEKYTGALQRLFLIYVHVLHSVHAKQGPSGQTTSSQHCDIVSACTIVSSLLPRTQFLATSSRNRHGSIVLL